MNLSCGSPAASHRIVIKVGSSTLTDPNGRIDRTYISSLARDIVEVSRKGAAPILVTSGAIRAGRERLERSRLSTEDRRSLTLPYKQAAAAVGQGLLMHTYTEAFANEGVTAAQVLLTRDDLAERHRFLNARNTFNALLSLGVVPVVNENDTVAVEEIRFGDNDTLAARVAVLVEAELLLILSDVEGLYDRKGQRIPVVETITSQIESIAGGVGSEGAAGGMKAKIEAARIATSAGIQTIITDGRRPAAIPDVLVGHEIGTRFLQAGDRPSGRKRWIAAGTRIHGAIHVNSGASGRLRSHGASLLAVGITCVEGSFEAGDMVELRDELGHRFARGLASYSASDIRQLQGLRSHEFESALGYTSGDEIIHRDNLVIERGA